MFSRHLHKSVCALSCISTTSAKKTTCTFVIVYKYSTNVNKKYVIKSKYNDITIPKVSLNQYVFENVAKWWDKTALVCGVTGREIKYGQLYKRSRAFAASLRMKLNVQDGDCIAIMLPNIPEYPLAALGAVEAGCVVTTINPVYKGDEVGRQIELSDANVIITTNHCYETCALALNGIKKKVPIIIIEEENHNIPEGTISFKEFSEDYSLDSQCLQKVRRGSEEIAFLPYSSGTTGLPKGVELTANNILANCEQIGHKNINPIIETTVDEVSTKVISPVALIALILFPTEFNHLPESLDLLVSFFPLVLNRGWNLKHQISRLFVHTSQQDSLLAILPFFHIYGLVVIMTHKLSLGCRIVTLPRFHPDTFLNAQAQYKCEGLFLAPPLALFLASHQSVDQRHLAPLRFIISGAAPLAASDAERLLARADNKNITLAQGYGLTETAPVVALQESGNQNYASIGIPVPSTELVIMSTEENEALPAGKVGELWVRGPQVMRGYRNNPTANKQVFVQGGWFRTGDLAYYDDNQNFYIADRLKELIKVKGYQVAPAELEGILRSHPHLLDAAVIGIPHPAHGEVPKAFVVPKPGHQPDLESVKEFLAEKVAPYKKLADIQIVNEIPKSAAGKILRRQLRDMQPSA